MSIYAPPSIETIFTATAANPVGNVTTATSLIPTVTPVNGKSLPANWFVPGRTLKVRLKGVYTSVLATSGAVVTIKLGSTTIATVTVTALANAATNLAFSGEVDIVCYTAGVSGSVGVAGGLNFTTGMTGQAFFDLSNSGNAVTLDTTQALTFDALFNWLTAQTNQAVKTVSCTAERLN